MPRSASNGNTAVTSCGYKFTNVAAGTATTTFKVGGGTLHGLNINTKGAASNTLTLYDNTAGSGTKIATLDTTASLGAIISFGAGIDFATGLTAVSATGTGADYTVVYL